LIFCSGKIALSKQRGHFAGRLRHILIDRRFEQDHRAIKQRYAPMKGFKSFANADITIAGIELAHRLHKHQFLLGQGRPRSERSLCTEWQRALAK
jgi:transposase-like protein